RSRIDFAATAAATNTSFPTTARSVVGWPGKALAVPNARFVGRGGLRDDQYKANYSQYPPMASRCSQCAARRQIRGRGERTRVPKLLACRDCPAAINQGAAPMTVEALLPGER